QIPFEVSDEQKQIQKLSQENNKLKNSIPKLSLTFEDGTTVFHGKLSPIKESEEEYLDHFYREIVGQYQEMEYEDLEKKNQEVNKKIKSAANSMEQLRLILQKSDWRFNQITKEQIETYNHELKNFYTEYKEYLKWEYKYNKLLSLKLPIDFRIHNKGNAPAVDIDIWLHFPDGFKLLNEGDFPDKPKKPSPPQKPKRKYDFETLNYPTLPNIHPFRHVENSIPDININKPEIRETNSYEVD